MAKTGLRYSSTEARLLHSGLRCPAHESAAGLLLLSMLDAKHYAGLLRRLNADARDEDKFNPFQVASLIAGLSQETGHAGALGFGTDLRTLSMLVPSRLSPSPLVIGLVHIDDEIPDQARLLRMLRADLDSVDGSTPRFRLQNEQPRGHDT